MAAGSGRINDDGKTIPLDVKVGDHVLIAKYSGTEIKLDGEDYLIVREDEILGVAEGVPERDGVGGRNHGWQADRLQRECASRTDARRQ